MVSFKISIFFINMEERKHTKKKEKGNVGNKNFERPNIHDQVWGKHVK